MPRCGACPFVPFETFYFDESVVALKAEYLCDAVYVLQYLLADLNEVSVILFVEEFLVFSSAGDGMLSSSWAPCWVVLCFLAGLGQEVRLLRRLRVSCACVRVLRP